MLPTRTRVLVGIAAVIGVASTELGTVFCFNTDIASAGILTIGVIFALSRVAMAQIGPRGGSLVAISSLGCIPATTIIAAEAMQLSLGRRLATSDSEDLMVLLLLVGGFALATTYAVRRAASDAPAQRMRSASWIVLLAAIIFLAAATAKRGVGFSVLVAGAGLLTAMGLAFAAWRTRKRHERPASGAIARHTGQGWIAFEDGTPPIHRPEVATQSEGPVIVQGWSAGANHGYRDRPEPTSPLAVLFGTAESIQNDGRDRAASYEAIAISVIAFSVVPLVPWPFMLAG